MAPTPFSQAVTPTGAAAPITSAAAVILILTSGSLRFAGHGPAVAGQGSANLRRRIMKEHLPPALRPQHGGAIVAVIASMLVGVSFLVLPMISASRNGSDAPVAASSVCAGAEPSEQRAVQTSIGAFDVPPSRYMAARRRVLPMDFSTVTLHGPASSCAGLVTGVAMPQVFHVRFARYTPAVTCPTR